MTTTEITGAEEVAWNLSDLYDGADDPRFETDIKVAEDSASAFRERYYGKVAELSASELAEAIGERERIESLLTRAAYFAHLEFATDMADPARGALVARLTEKGAALETQLLFFGLEIADLADEAAEELLASSELEKWDHWMRSLRKFRPYLLSESEEKIVTEKSVSGVSAWDRLYEELLGALRVEIDGTEVGFEEAMSKLHSYDREERRNAAEAVTRALEPGLRTRSFIFNTILLDKSIDDRHLLAEPPQRDDGRGRAGADRRRRVPLRRRPALLPPEGGHARRGPDRVLRPVRPHLRGRREGELGRSAGARDRGVLGVLAPRGRHRRTVLP
jgi:oligoendopeptidase F